MHDLPSPLPSPVRLPVICVALYKLFVPSDLAGIHRRHEAPANGIDSSFDLIRFDATVPPLVMTTLDEKSAVVNKCNKSYYTFSGSAQKKGKRKNRFVTR